MYRPLLAMSNVLTEDIAGYTLEKDMQTTYPRQQSCLGTRFTCMNVFNNLVTFLVYNMSLMYGDETIICPTLHISSYIVNVKIND